MLATPPFKMLSSRVLQERVPRCFVLLLFRAWQVQICQQMDPFLLMAMPWEKGRFSKQRHVRCEHDCASRVSVWATSGSSLSVSIGTK